MCLGDSGGLEPKGSLAKLLPLRQNNLVVDVEAGWIISEGFPEPVRDRLQKKQSPGCQQGSKPLELLFLQVHLRVWHRWHDTYLKMLTYILDEPAG
jgi:hypothetical protein